MDKFDRIFHLHAILAARRTPISLEDLTARLECSKSTLYRAINVLKDTLHAPVEFDAEVGGFRYAGAKGESAFELPGLWFTPAELQALAVMQRLLRDVGGGLLSEHLGPLSKRLDELTRHRRLNLGEAASRLRFPAIGARPAGPAFQTCASATLQRKRLWIEYHARGTDERSERTVSPQRVTHYRESWYLDAWDDGKGELRCFAIDRILRVTLLKQRAVDVADPELDAHYASAYGIFGGRADKIAVLRFTPERARLGGGRSLASGTAGQAPRGRWLRTQNSLSRSAGARDGHLEARSARARYRAAITRQRSQKPAHRSTRPLPHSLGGGRRAYPIEHIAKNSALAIPSLTF